MIRRGCGRGPGREAEVKEEEEPLVKMARDHGLDFRFGLDAGILMAGLSR